MSSPHRSRTITALAAVAILALGFTACSDSDSSSTRTASSSDCPARYGCAKFAADFEVVNGTDAPITLEAKAIENVRSSDRSILTLSVPARSTSPKLAVVLGDDGFEDGNGGYIPGRSEGTWTWSIRSGSSTTESRIELAASKDDSIGIMLYESRAHIGQPLASWGSAYNPVTLTSTSGVASFSAVGSISPDFETAPQTASWTFRPAS